ncbi:MAG: MBL fold metallo-hydrolase, partial [Anaerolineaceae bacterium]
MSAESLWFEIQSDGDVVRIHPVSCGLGVGFLIETPHGMFLIDSGSPGEHGQVLGKMKELGRTDLKVIWITHAHYDHYGSATALRRATGARIGVHPADAASLVRGKSPLGTPHQYGFIYPIAQPVVKLFKPLPAAPPDFTLEDGETLERFG